MLTKIASRYKQSTQSNGVKMSFKRCQNKDDVADLEKKLQEQDGYHKYLVSKLRYLNG